MTDTKIRDERLAVKGSGFDSQSGGFAVIHVGDQTYTKAEVIAALRTASLPKKPVVPAGWHDIVKTVAYELCTHKELRITLGQMEHIEQAVASALRAASIPKVEPAVKVKPRGAIS